MDDITDSLKDDDIAPFTKVSEFQKSPLSSERSWTERTLGKMEAGSVRGSIFALVSTAIGAGCLTIPLIFN